MQDWLTPTFTSSFPRGLRASCHAWPGTRGDRKDSAALLFALLKPEPALLPSQGRAGCPVEPGWAVACCCGIHEGAGEPAGSWPADRWQPRCSCGGNGPSNCSIYTSSAHRSFSQSIHPQPKKREGIVLWHTSNQCIDVLLAANEAHVPEADLRCGEELHTCLSS